jgi:hypothetical protein
MKLRRAGVRRLALIVGILGMLLGVLGCVMYFQNIQGQIDRFDLVQRQVAAGIILQHDDGTLWWKDRGGQEHPYVEALPTRRPDPTEAYWGLLMPVVGFGIPWCVVMVLAWMITGLPEDRSFKIQPSRKIKCPRRVELLTNC